MAQWADGEEVWRRDPHHTCEFMKSFAAAAMVSTLAVVTAVPAQAFGLGSLIQAAAGVPPTTHYGQTRYENDGEDYLEDPVSQVTNQAAAQGASKASGGNGTVVQGEGNVVNTQQVTHIHHHHYTTNNSSVKVNQPPRC